VLNALADRPGVSFDTAGVELNEGMVSVAGAQRVLLGSGAPIGDPVRALRQVRSLRLPPDQIATVLGDNALRLFDPDATR
jgi:predicted TIM-barrel fold metal-dependent hydrolase